MGIVSNHSSNMNIITKDVELVTKQFLCKVPLNEFRWNNIFSGLILDEIAQKTLLDKTINSKLVSELPLAMNYQKSFLKYIITRLEDHQQKEELIDQETVICDELYSSYVRLVTLDVTADGFKHYVIEQEGKVISLKESSNLISDGTTGLRTWQAAFVLSEWILKNETFFKNETILELGSGVGLVGLVLRECSPKRIYLTDCHPTVLKILCQNLKLNMNECSGHVEKNKEKYYHAQERTLYHSIGPPDTYIIRLPWEEVDREQCEKFGKIDSIMAADIIYDEDLFSELIDALKCITEECHVKRIIFSCTERNPDTLKSFLMQMNAASFSEEALEIPEQTNFIWPTDTPTKLFSFKRSI